jgi:lambda family phage tail tape measure protein
VFLVGEQQVQASLRAWEQQMRDVANAELTRRDATPGERAAHMAELQERIAQKAEEVRTAIFDAMMRNVDRQLEAVEEAFNRRLLGAQTSASIAEGIVAGLGSQSLQGRVPDFVAQLAQRRSGLAQEQLQQQTSNALGQRISDVQTIMNNLSAGLAARAIAGNIMDPGQIEAMDEKLEGLNDEIARLRAEKAQLDAQLSAGGLIPVSLSAGLDQAIAAYREANNVNNTFTQDVLMNMTGAIESVHSGLTDMFTSIFNGSRGALGAFANFAKGIMNYMSQIAARMVATRIMGMLFSLFGAGAAPSLSLGSPSSWAGGTASVFEGMFGYNGGRVVGYQNGGRIINGITQRDSMNARLAKDEWVVRKAAVDSVGHEFMADLNRNGSKALDAMRGMPQVSVRPVTDLKVYMVKPEERPQLGPNEFLVTWQDDVLSGGQSKTLIKHVVQETLS